MTRADILVRLALLGIIAVSLPLLLWSLWLAGGIGGILTHLAWPDVGPGDSVGIAVRLPAHLGDPARAWPAAARADAPPGWMLYPLWLLLFATHLGGAVAGGAVGLRRVVRRQGFASRRDLDRLMTAPAVLGRADVVRPGLSLRDDDPPATRLAKLERRSDPLEVARFLGHDALTGQPLYLANEYSELCEAAARFGNKTTRFVIPRVIDARGAVISTSTRLDVAEVTFERRSELGPTWIFEPQGELPNVPRLRWSPIQGCTGQVVAMLRANGFAAGSEIGAQGVENGKWFQDQAAAIIRALLHAAALDGAATMVDVVSWADNPSITRPELILRHHGVAWAERLTRHREAAGRTRDTIQSVVAGALDAFNDPRVLAACSPPRDHQFDPQAWQAESGTLYLVGTRDAQALIAPLFAAIIEDLIYQSKRSALTAPGGRIEPTLYFIGDEITNIAPIPSLPSLMSEGGGTGIATSIFCQNSHQLHHRFGDKAGRAIEAAANARITLGGTGDVAALRDVQSLAGQVHEVMAGATWGGGKASVQESAKREHLVDLADLRTLPTGHALVMLGNLSPVEVTLPSWWERPDADILRASQTAFQQRLAKDIPGA
jgi:hypothetical protein